MAKKNFFDAIKKSYDAQAITKDTYSLKDYYNEFAVVKKGKEETPARMRVKGFIAKWVVSDKLENRNGAGYRTTIILENGETIGTFSMAAQRLMETFLDMTGSVLEGKFQKLDLDGFVEFDVSVIPLEDKKSTYEFTLVDGEVAGMLEDRPANLLLSANAAPTLTEAVDITEEATEESATE